MSCKIALACSPCPMPEEFRERGRWLARHVLPHEALIRSKLKNICFHDLDIEDVIQEMYARFLSLPSLETIRYPRQYALLTARAIVIDHVRHSRVVSITSSGNLDELDIAEPSANSEERLQFQQEIAAVNNALAQLPKACRETLILRRVEGLPQREVARRLQISEKTVEKYMANGVRLLIEIFGRGGKPRLSSSHTEQTVDLSDVSSKSRD